MAYLRQLKTSPHWIACYVDVTGRETNRTTKLEKSGRNKPAALALAKEFEKAARKARQGEMTQAAAIKVLNDCVEHCTGDSLHVASIAEHFSGYLTSRETKGKAESTVKRYKPILDGFVAHIGPNRARASIGSVTTQEIESYHAAEIAAGKGGTTANFAVKVLRAVMESAHRKGLCLSNPALAVELSEATPEEREVFTSQELRYLLTAAADSDWYGMILVGAHCGLRINDAASLTWEAVDLNASTIRFRAQKTRQRSRKDTIVVMHRQLTDWLTERAGDDPRAPLFPSLAGKKTGSHGGLSNAFSRLMKLAGIRPTLGDEKEGKGRRFRSKGFHALRHTMITRLATASVSADIRRAMVGHSSDAIHKKYIHLDTSSQQAAVKNLPGI